MNNDKVSGDILRQYIERIEKLEEEKTEFTIHIREIYNEAKSSGYDVSVIRRIIRDRKMRKDERDELEALIDLYKHAIGMI